jgi:hypothetical protein
VFLYDSNVARGKRQKEGKDDAVPCILEPQGNEKAYRKSWARLIQKIYEVDPLICPKCQGTMRVISAIDDRQVIRATLEHLGLWLVRSRPPPKIHDPPILEHAAAFGGDILRKPAGSATCPRNEHADTIGACPRPDRGADPEYTWDEYIQS